MSELTPREIVNELDRYIIGQHDAKRAVAIALRNRWRRMQLEPELRNEVTPKNILMIGPTGVGKTEIARRLATLANAPFVKVEATKFTEVGYVGKDVESIMRDLADVAYKLTREQAIKRVRSQAEDRAEDRILDALLPRRQTPDRLEPRCGRRASHRQSDTRQKLRKQLREGALDEREIELDFAMNVGVEIMSPPGMEEMGAAAAPDVPEPGRRQDPAAQAGDQAGASAAGRRGSRQAAQRRGDPRPGDGGGRAERHRLHRRDRQGGAAFSEWGGAGVSREGVQRDLLPLVEGSTVSTKYGPIKTDHMLFIASGAFSLAKPSDLIPELQGRLPIRVELSALSVDDFKRILREPHNALTKQYVALLGTEGVAARVHRLRRRPAGRGGVPGERAHREHRRPPPAHRDGTAAGEDLLRSCGQIRRKIRDRRRICRQQSRQPGQGRGS